MGKYTKKPKITCDVAVMEVGVRTRAKSLALQKLQSPNPDTSSYLQLRSRRLEKIIPSRPPIENPSPKKNHSFKANSSSGVANSSSSHSNSKDREVFWSEFGGKEGENEDWSVEASFGENNLECDGRGRSARESTPCSYIRDPIRAETPCSTTRRTSSTASNQRAQRNNPTAQEIEDFFASAEKQQQKLFAEKYNFDVVNDVPLPGRYEWVKVKN